jgi:NADH:ubiquinone oxidoreductase subunit F (NADH-binding)
MQRSVRWSAMAASWCMTTRPIMSKLARYAMEFCAIESCGKCTPCRIGSTRGVEVIDRIVGGTTQTRPQQVELLARPVRHHGAWLAVRHGRHDAVSRCCPR